MPTIIERRGRFQAVIRRAGFRTKAATFDTHADATDWLAIADDPARLEPAPAAGAAVEPEPGERTLGDLADWYAAEFHASGMRDRMKLPRVAWWVERIGHTPLAEVTAPLLKTTLDQYRAGEAMHGYPGGQQSLGRPRSTATVNRMLACLSAVYTTAIEHETAEWPELDETNPCRAVKRGKESRGRTRWLRTHEYERLLRVCRKSDWDGLHLLVLLALKTAARLGELLPLRWHEVDLERRTIYLTDTKNGDDRTLVLLPDVVAELRAQRQRVAAGLDDLDALPDAMVFPPRQAGAEKVNVYDHWYAALRAARIEGACFHTLRHTAASHLAQSGASTLQIAQALGHRTLALAQRYAHLSTADTEAALTRAFPAAGAGGGGD